MQALRYAVEEINSNITDKRLLPGVTLGYQTFDLCSLPASNLATLDLLGRQRNSSGVENLAVAVIGPDSSTYSFTPAAALGAVLMPQVQINMYFNNVYVISSYLHRLDQISIHDGMIFFKGAKIEAGWIFAHI